METGKVNEAFGADCVDAGICPRCLCAGRIVTEGVHRWGVCDEHKLRWRIGSMPAAEQIDRDKLDLYETVALTPSIDRDEMYEALGYTTEFGLPQIFSRPEEFAMALRKARQNAASARMVILR